VVDVRGNSVLVNSSQLLQAGRFQVKRIIGRKREPVVNFKSLRRDGLASSIGWDVNLDNGGD